MVNKHGNVLPEKPTAHQAGRPRNSFIINMTIKKHDRQKSYNKDTDTDMDRSQVWQ